MLRSRLDPAELLDRNWLLAFEAARQGWHGDVAGVAADDNFGQLFEAGVSFYDPSPVAPVAYLVDVSGYGDLADLTHDRDVNPEF